MFLKPLAPLPFAVPHSGIPLRETQREKYAIAAKKDGEIAFLTATNPE